MSATQFKTAAKALGVGAIAFALLSCGGTENERRPRKVVLGVHDLPDDDPGSGPFSCAQDDAYEIELIEDYETQAATGWFTNNDICERCDRIKAVLSWYSKFRNCLFNEGALNGEFLNPEREFRGVTGANIDSGKSCYDVALDVTFRKTKTDLEDISDKKLEKLVQAFAESLDTEEQDYIGDVIAAYGGGAKWLEKESQFDTLSQEEQDRLVLALINKMHDAAGEFIVLLQGTPCRTTKDTLVSEITCEESQTPDWFAKPLIAEKIPNGGRCGSKFGFHFRTVALNVWGATTGRSFARDQPADGSDFDGISFWARRGPSSGGVLRLQVPESQTTEKYYNQKNGSTPCSFTSTLDDDDNACDAFGFVNDLGPNWEFFAIPFTELRQAGFGKSVGTFDQKRIMGIEFSMKLGHWDIWLDDVGFYRKN